MRSNQDTLHSYKQKPRPLKVGVLHAAGEPWLYNTTIILTLLIVQAIYPTSE